MRGSFDQDTNTVFPDGRCMESLSESLFFSGFNDSMQLRCRDLRLLNQAKPRWDFLQPVETRGISPVGAHLHRRLLFPFPIGKPRRQDKRRRENEAMIHKTSPLLSPSPSATAEASLRSANCASFAPPLLACKYPNRFYLTYSCTLGHHRCKDETQKRNESKQSSPPHNHSHRLSSPPLHF